MKLCRFELREKPGEVRSGIVRASKVYETDGANPVAIHEAEDIIPLAPLGQPGAVRLFQTRAGDWGEVEGVFSYLNPAAILGPSKILPYPHQSGAVDYEVYAAAVSATGGSNIPVEVADDTLLGLTLVIAIVFRDSQRSEKVAGFGPGRSMDFALAVGPVLSTPEELEDYISDESAGKRYEINAVTRVNGVEQRRGSFSELPITFAQAVSLASESCIVRPGDLFLIGPLALKDPEERLLQPNDQVQLAVEQIGTLSLRLAL